MAEVAKESAPLDPTENAEQGGIPSLLHEGRRGRCQRFNAIGCGTVRRFDQEGVGEHDKNTMALGRGFAWLGEETGGSESVSGTQLTKVAENVYHRARLCMQSVPRTDTVPEDGYSRRTYH